MPAHKLPTSVAANLCSASSWFSPVDGFESWCLQWILSNKPFFNTNHHGCSLMLTWILHMEPMILMFPLLNPFILILFLNSNIFTSKMFLFLMMVFGHNPKKRYLPFLSTENDMVHYFPKWNRWDERKKSLADAWKKRWFCWYINVGDGENYLLSNESYGIYNSILEISIGLWSHIQFNRSLAVLWDDARLSILANRVCLVWKRKTTQPERSWQIWQHLHPTQTTWSFEDTQHQQHNRSTSNRLLRT